jgi:hypothetical protein
MAWILLCFDVLPTIKTRKVSHAMLHQNSVFHGMLKHVPWHSFDLGAAPVKRSTLSDANAVRPWQVFGDPDSDWHVVRQHHDLFV